MPYLTLASLGACLAITTPSFAAPQAPPQGDSACTLRGVLVDDAGAPVAGATLQVRGWQGNADRVRQFPVPQGWADPAPFTSDAEGRFSVSFVPPRAFQFTLDVEAEGRGRIGWRWSDIDPGAELDLATTVLEPEALLVGHIVDGAGNLLAAGWVVTAYYNWNSGLGARTSRHVTSAVDSDTGQFRIEGLPPGKLRVEASSGSARIPPVEVVSQKGSVTSLELRYDGPDPARRLVVSISTRPFHPFRPAEGTVHAIGPDGARHALVPEPGRANDWYVPDIAPGSYRVEVRDPRFDEWTLEDVRSGVPARARLEGRAALRVTVVDGDTGAPVEAYALDIGYRGVSFSPNVFRMREASSVAPPSELYRGIVPGELTVEAIVAGWPNARVEVDALAPGETREVEVRLQRASTLRGRVVDVEGRPLRGVEVQVTRGDVPGHEDPGGGTRSTSGTYHGKAYQHQVPYRDAVVLTADDGTFAFDGLGVGEHTLIADLGRFVEASAHAVLPSDEVTTLVAPPSYAVSVRVLLPEGTAADALSLSASFMLPGEFSHLLHARANFEDMNWRAGADGVFPAELLPPGLHPYSLNRTITDDHGFGAGDGYIGILRVEIDAARNGEVVLDLREQFPVQVSVTAHEPAGTPARVSWSLVPSAGAPRVLSMFRPRSGGPTACNADVPPGTYTLRASGPGFEWSHPEPVEIVRGAENRFSATLPLITRALRVLDADGAPRPKAFIAYWTSRGARATAETNDEGFVTLALLEGEASLALLPPPDPADEQVKLARKLGNSPPIAPEVLGATVADVTVRFEAGEASIDVRLGQK